MGTCQSLLLDDDQDMFRGLVVSDTWSLTLYESLQGHLKALIQDPSPLHQWILARSHQRLGRYFESLLGYALYHCPLFSDVQQGILVKDKQRSLGELDFVFKDQSSGQFCHLEIAVKFYLRLDQSTTLDSFVGHQGGDRFSHKIRLMVEKQIPLSDLYFQSTLPTGDMGQLGRIRKLILVKGYLFSSQHDHRASPPGSPQNHLGAIAGINPRALHGRWVLWSEWRDFLANWDHCFWMILEKKQWLAPVHGSEAVSFLKSDHITAPLEPLMSGASAAPLQVSQIQVHKAHQDRFKEIDRVFIVPDQWLKVCGSGDTCNTR